MSLISLIGAARQHTRAIHEATRLRTPAGLSDEVGGHLVAHRLSMLRLSPLLIAPKLLPEVPHPTCQDSGNTFVRCRMSHSRKVCAQLRNAAGRFLLSNSGLIFTSAAAQNTQKG